MSSNYDCKTRSYSAPVAWLRFLWTFIRIVIARADGQRAIYVSGPMRGYHCYNYDAFDTAVADLRMQIPRAYIFSPTTLGEVRSWEGHELAWNWYMMRDLALVAFVTDIALLPGYQSSAGANKEIGVAEAVGAKKLFLQRRHKWMTLYISPDGKDKIEQGAEYWEVVESHLDPELAELDVSFKIVTKDSHGRKMASPLAAARLANGILATVERNFNGAPISGGVVEIQAPVVHSSFGG